MQDTESEEERKAFEFVLADVPEREALHDDEVVEFFRQQLLNLLDVLVPTVDGRPVQPDGFAFLKDPEQIYALWRREDPRD